MKIYMKENVFDAAFARIERLYHEFGTIAVNSSGGKDSTVAMNMAILVARKLGKLPLDVIWLDQEYEWSETARYMERLATNPDVRLHWYQIPSMLGNAFNAEDRFAHCWWPEEEWIREKSPFSIKENTFGTFRFKELLDAIPDTIGFKVVLTGVRGEESRARMVGLTSDPTYKDITWGARSQNDKDCYRFHPLYDWQYNDVWAAISQNKWDYNRVYDGFYKLGLPISKWRVSSLIHEQSFRDIFILQMLDKDMYQALSKKVGGISMGKNLGYTNMAHFEKPSWFSTWEDFFFYLMDHADILHVRDDYKSKSIKNAIMVYSYLATLQYFAGESRDIKKYIQKTKDESFRELAKSLLLNDFENYRVENLKVNLSGNVKTLLRKKGVDMNTTDVRNVPKQYIINFINA